MATKSTLVASREGDGGGGGGEGTVAPEPSHVLPDSVTDFVHKHADIVVALLGVAVLICICLVVLIVYLCWKRSRARKDTTKDSKQRISRATRPPNNLRYRQPKYDKVTKQYSQLRNEPSPEDIFDQIRIPEVPSSSRSAQQRTSIVDVRVHPPGVVGEVLNDRHKQIPTGRPQTPQESTRTLYIAGRPLSIHSSGRSDNGRYNAVVSPDSPGITSPLAPYVTPMVDARSGSPGGNQHPTSTRFTGKSTGIYPDLPNTRLSPTQQQSGLGNMEASAREQDLLRMQDLVHRNLQDGGGAKCRRGGRQEKLENRKTVPGGRTARTLPADVSRRASGMSRRTQSSGEDLQDLPVHRGPGTPTSVQSPAMTPTKSDPNSRAKTILVAFNKRHAGRPQPPSEPPHRPLKRGPQLVSTGTLRKPSIRNSMHGSSMDAGYLDGESDFERSRKRSHSMPNLFNPEEEEEPTSPKPRSGLGSAISSILFTYTSGSSRNVSPGVYEDVIGQHGAIMFSIRYDRFEQCVVVSDMRCSQLPGRSAPDSYIKCRLLPLASIKMKTKVVTGTRNPEYTGQVFHFRNYSMTEAQQSSLLFEIMYCGVVYGGSLAAQVVYQVAQQPLADDARGVFLNLEGPNAKVKFRRLKKPS